tara:strand:- start:18524 stop:18991 length:468 start_codon:yes stop_codon:yes gene_type:complete
LDQNKEFQERIKKAEQTAHRAAYVTFFAALLLLLTIYYPQLGLGETKPEVIAEVVEDEDRIENGIHLRTGLKDGEGLMTVVNNCTNCHSAKLVTQNRMTAERWNTTIKWMQETQSLWELGEDQKIIVDYLVKNYPPQKKGRRLALTNIEWYELED